MLLRLALLSVLLVSFGSRVVAAEPFLKPNDVIALVGGEDMVAASEYGYLELLLQRALPDYHLKVRCLAWEGDTVYEQPRDLNYPSLEQQLDEIGATVVIMQFGQMESLAGTSKLPEFIKAYEKLIERVKGGKRRVVIQDLVYFDTGPTLGSSRSPIAVEQLRKSEASVSQYEQAIVTLQERGPIAEHLISAVLPDRTRDGLHNWQGAARVDAFTVADKLANLDSAGISPVADWEKSWPELIETIRAKNRLWFHYYRPQNWAFLAGDRTEQPSSRDWKDPSKRWFPEEMKQYLPLIDQKEKEIWALAAKAAKP